MPSEQAGRKDGRKRAKKRRSLLRRGEGRKCDKNVGFLGAFGRYLAQCDEKRDQKLTVFNGFGAKRVSFGVKRVRFGAVLEKTENPRIVNRAGRSGVVRPL